MTIHYLDSSAWVKRYFEEAGSGRIHRLFQDKELLAASSLGRVEVAAAIARQSSSRRISSDRIGDDVRTLIESQMDREWGLFLQAEAGVGDFVSAVELARTYALRGADAIHLAIVCRLHGEFRATGDRLVFQTADAELVEAGRTAGLWVENPLTP